MDNFLSPITTFWILSIIAFVFIILKRKKTAKIFLIIAFLDLFIFSVTPLPTYLLKKLEQQYIPINTNKLDKNLPIMVLGGGHTNDHNLPTTNQLSSVALPRLVEGVRLYKQINGSTFILSGYTNKNNAPHAEVMAKSAISLGVNKKDTIMLIKPGTTWDEAIAFKKRFGSKQKFILVTSASHMPRAMKAFKN
ncbi:ElyC/SanA/YdcF family protein, partial [uncultured Flavobacterium sp.]|uniref:ElyC/SanA/YdcF family protein n=1 Tax=uncultured Flavobacterium sp. TaxID=165435 RepID=UPI0025E6BA2E